MDKITSVLNVLLFFVLSLSSSHRRESVILDSREVGLFSVMYDVIELLINYDKGLYIGVEVNFGTSGLYYDPNMGPNWWNYYFEPIKLGNFRKRSRKFAGGGDHYQYVVGRPRTLENNQILNKYIHLRPHVREKVDLFYRENLEGFYKIGIHYRGTDKSSEAPRQPYDLVYGYLEQEIAKLPNDNYKVFVATDESLFIQYLSERLDTICYVKDIIRSDNLTPLHVNPKSPYKSGEDAVIDCFLLSKCDLLIKTSSNLSEWSTYLNPNMKCINIK